MRVLKGLDLVHVIPKSRQRLFCTTLTLLAYIHQFSIAVESIDQYGKAKMQLKTFTIVALGSLGGPLAAAYFHCPTVNETGFQPSCCHAVVGQVGIWCMYLHEKQRMAISLTANRHSRSHHRWLAELRLQHGPAHQRRKLLPIYRKATHTTVSSIN